MTRALILAAGLGTRLGVLSDERPKPLFPVLDVPLIQYALALLRGHGITEIAVNLHHHGARIRAELGDGFFYSEEPVILGTGGGIKKLADWLTRGGRESFVVMNGKVVTNLDVGAAIREHEEAGAEATMVVREVPDARRWGAIDVDDDGRVTGIIGHGRSGAHACMFTGIHLLSPRLVARLPDGVSDSIRDAYVPALLKGALVRAIRYNGYWHEHSTPARYLEGNWNLLSGAIEVAHPPGILRAISGEAVIEPGATLSGNVVVGARSRVRAGAKLDRVVVWPDSVVDGALDNAIVTPRTIVRV